MTKRFLLLISLFVFVALGMAQVQFPAYYAVYLKDKKPTSFQLQNPQQFLSADALERRNRYGLAIDSSDLPVCNAYLNILAQYGKIKYSSRWQNSALLQVEDSFNRDALASLSMVHELQYLGPSTDNKKARKQRTLQQSEELFLYDSLVSYGESEPQLAQIGVPPLHKSDIWGKKVRIAILDAGFYKVDKNIAFDHIRNRSGFLNVRDFVNPQSNIYQENSHGAYVLSTIGAYLPNTYIGVAPEADFFLFRTENVRSEFPIEEYYWLVAAEYADSLGVDVITTSLSYFAFDDSSLDYNHAQLDGKSTIISRAAQKAAEKEILVCCSAGNEGDNAWRKIGFPADAKDVITVGAVDVYGMHASLSSQGNTVDHRIKPDVMATGYQTALVTSKGKVFYGNGTSFSAPIIAGGVALLRQMFPKLSAQQIRQALRVSCKQFYRPDSLMGYGIPNIYMAALLLNKTYSSDENTEDILLLPNPVSDVFYVVFNAPEPDTLLLEVYDLKGQKIIHKTSRVESGRQVIMVPFPKKYASATYFVKMTIGGKIFTKKIVKLD